MAISSSSLLSAPTSRLIFSVISLTIPHQRNHDDLP
jgi:hypothetical protein